MPANAGNDPVRGDDVWPPAAVILRALRETRGVTQQGWAGWLGYSVATVRRWETGAAAPTAEAESALVAECERRGLFRVYDAGPLRGLTLTPEVLRDALARARLQGTDRIRGSEVSRRESTAASPRLVWASRDPTDARPPVPLSSFIGRLGEIAAARRLLTTARLLTLTGPGGVGKTRLAIEVAGAVTDDFPDGVSWVDLTPLTDPELVPATIAQALGVRELAENSPMAALRAALRDLQLLLILDNFEHVLPAAPLVLELLSSCPRMRMLVTSRAGLRLRGEQLFPVPPLSVPDSVGPADVETLVRSEAVNLLVKRAQEARPSFVLAPDNAAAVGAICRRLDGLPLALELAAARLHLLPPETLLSRLDQRLQPLSGTARDLPARHRTLRATMDWSYELLDDPERRLFCRLAVFSGGFGLAAAEAVFPAAEAAGLDVVDLLSGLVSQSLVRVDEQAGEPRYRLLETIRQYAQERLAEIDEADSTRTAHLEWCVLLAERAQPLLGGPEQAAWIARLGREHENVRSALRWGLDRGLAEPVLRLGAAFWRFWWTRAYFQEGRRWLEELLALDAPVAPAVQAGLLEGAGFMAYFLGNLAEAERCMQDALVVRRAEGDPQSIARTLGWQSLAVAAGGDLPRATRLAQEGAALARQSGDTRTLAQALVRFGTHVTLAGDAQHGAPLLEEGVSLAQQAGDLFTVAAGLNTLGLAERLRGDLTTAGLVLEEDLRLVNEVGYGITAAEVRYQFADVLWRQGQIERAGTLCQEGLRLAHAAGDARRVANALRVAAAIEVAQAHYEQAAMLCTVAQAVLAAKGIPFMPVEQTELEACLAAAVAGLGRVAFNAARARGRALDISAFSRRLATLSDLLND